MVHEEPEGPSGSAGGPEVPGVSARGRPLVAARGRPGPEVRGFDFRLSLYKRSTEPPGVSLALVGLEVTSCRSHSRSPPGILVPSALRGSVLYRTADGVITPVTSINNHCNSVNCYSGLSPFIHYNIYIP